MFMNGKNIDTLRTIKLETFEIIFDIIKRINVGMETNFTNLMMSVNFLFVIFFRKKCCGRLWRMIKSFQSLQKDTNKPTEVKKCERIFRLVERENTEERQNDDAKAPKNTTFR